MAFGSVYTFGPTFRAEKSKTRRHLNEFWMLEPEVCYLDHEGSLKLQEDLIEYIVQNVIKSCTLELKTLGRDIKELEIIKAPFPRITYDKAVEMLKENGMEIEWGEDFGAPHEIYLSEQFNGLPVFVTHYPKDCKAFYMEPDPDRPDTVKCADLLYPGFGEIIGGSERIHDLDILLQRIQEENLPMEVYDWYADLRKDVYKRQGIEVFHTKHNQDMVKLFMDFAKKHDLIITGGSDCHGVFTDGISLLGSLNIDKKYLDILKTEFHI